MTDGTLTCQLRSARPALPTLRQPPAAGRLAIPGARSPQDLQLLNSRSVLALQRLAGNQAVVQRLNGAAPQGFVVANGPVDHAQCKVNTPATWTSSVPPIGNLADVNMRERVDFGEDPRVKVPGYGVLMAMDGRFNLAGNVMTKNAGAMGTGAANDEHSGAAYGPKFTINGVPNLRKGAWVLAANQRYQYQSAPGVWTDLMPGQADFVVTRTMAWQADHFELTTSKAGPGGVNVLAGPTRIDFETHQAMQALTALRPNQDAGWAADLLSLTRTGLVAANIATDNLVVQGQPVTVTYEQFQPGGVVDPLLRGPGGGLFIPPTAVEPAEVALLHAQARAGITTVIQKALGPGGQAPPPRIVFSFYPEGAGGVRQQSYVTTAGGAGGTLRVLLKGAPIGAGPGYGQSGALVGNFATSQAGSAAWWGWTQAGKLERFCKATAIHELGHMLHAAHAPDVFQQSTLAPGIGNPIQPGSPVYEESLHVAAVNAAVLAALAALGPAVGQWTYAMANPAEVVAESFVAMMDGSPVPKKYAAVYLAYRGPRSTEIDRQLAKSFRGGPIPNIATPEDAVNHMV